MIMLTKEQLETIKERLSASLGPYVYSDNYGLETTEGDKVVSLYISIDGDRDYEIEDGDREFLTNAHADVANLIATIEEQLEIIDQLTKVEVWQVDSSTGQRKCLFCQAVYDDIDTESSHMENCALIRGRAIRGGEDN